MHRAESADGARRPQPAADGPRLSASSREPYAPVALSRTGGLGYVLARPAPGSKFAMFPKPKSALTPNTYAYESEPLVKPTGFREYDARWWFGVPGSTKAPELNLIGVQALGLGLGTLIRDMGVEPKIVTGHDFRAYSLSIKQALTLGLIEAGMNVLDIGLALSPVA